MWFARACLLLLLLHRVSAEAWLPSVRALLRGCPLGLSQAASCARRRALAAIDRILEDERIPLLQGLQLVAAHGHSAAGNRSRASSLGDVLEHVRQRDTARADEPQAEQGLAAWSSRLSERLARVLGTHVVQVELEGGGRVEPRGRRRRRRQMQMMPIVMMGVLLMGSVLVPMGFQFLAVLGGKALLLAKMALMLSSIQGLKKIATNGVNYGLYHSPVPEAAWHERSTQAHHLDAYAHPYPNYSPPLHSYLETAPAAAYLAHRRSDAAANLTD